MAEKKHIPSIRFKGFDSEYEEKKFNNIVLNLSGGAAIRPSDYQNTGIRTIPKGAVNDTGIADLSGTKYVSKDFCERNISSKVSTNNLVTSLRDLVPTAPNMGRIVKILGEAEDFLMPQGVYKIELCEHVNTDFIIAYSNSYQYRKVISREKNGSTQVHIRNGEFLNIEIFIPSDPTEQVSIGNYFQHLDKLISLHQTKVNKLTNLKKAMLEKMFPKQGADVPEIRFKGFAGAWEQKEIHALADRHDNLRIPITAANRTPGPVPYYGANGIQDYVDGYTHEGEFILIAEDGANDLKNYPVQYVNGKIWVNNHAHVLQGKNKIASNLFLKCAFSQVNIEPFLVGGGRAKLNAETMMKIEMPVPKSIDEQNKIGSYFQNLDKTITLHQTELEKLNHLKKACLEKMFV